MPVYEYECTACRIRFERQQSFQDAPVRTCPDCGSETKRVFHPVGIIFKGSGFYVTDNRKPSTPSAASSGSKTDDGGGSSGSSGSSGGDSAKSEAKTSGAKSDSTEKATSTSAS